MFMSRRLFARLKEKLVCYIQSCNPSSMQIPFTLILVCVISTLGKTDANVSKLLSLSSTSEVVQQMVPVKITHDLQTEDTWTGNDVILKGITALDIKVPSVQYNIIWSKDNKKIAYITNRVYFENQKLHLRLNDVRLTDAGTYEFQIMYMAMDNNKPSVVREISNILLVVHDDGDLCSDTEMQCRGYCIPKHQRCTGGNTSLGLIIGAVIGSVIIILACVLLFLLSRRGRELCRNRQGDIEADGGTFDDRVSSDERRVTNKKRNGAVVSFAATTTVQIYEREDEDATESGNSSVDDNESQSCQRNGTIECETTTV
ncbi:uncharacterized protein [Ptychodera flava]|uniref:uncharacterized protein n=1 Tax=Ptychodera flava TaxID=63121 RepID=UPI00396A9013